MSGSKIQFIQVKDTMITIEIDDDGAVQISEGGRPVDTVDFLQVEFERSSPSPKVRIRLVDVTKGSGDFDSYRSDKVRLTKYPFAQVTDPNDTLPTGMPAVRIDD